MKLLELSQRCKKSMPELVDIIKKEYSIPYEISETIRIKDAICSKLLSRFASKESSNNFQSSSDQKPFNKVVHSYIQKDELEIFNSSDDSVIVTKIESFSESDVTVSFFMGGNLTLDIKKFSNHETIKKGKIVCLKQSDKNSEFNVLSIEDEQRWKVNMMNDSYSLRRTINGKLMYPYIKGDEKIGYFVNIYGFRALMYINEMTKLSNYEEGSSIRVMIDKFDSDSKPLKVIVSYDKPLNISQQLQSINVGQRLTGCIVKVYSYGLLVRVDYLFGFVNKNDVFHGYSHRKLDDLFKEGDILDVEVKSLENTDDNGKYHIEFSHKSCISNPWESGQYNEGSICECKLIKIIDSGILVEVEPGFDGIIPASEMPHKLLEQMKRLKSVEIIGKIEVRIIQKDSNDMKLFLSILQKLENWDEVWLQLSKNYQIGCIYSAKVVSIEEDELWVELEEFFEAKIPSNEFFWLGIKRENINLTIGEEIKVKIIDINKEKKSTKASIKQCEPNPWTLASEFIKDSAEVHFKILSELPNKYEIEILDNYHLIGFLQKSELSWTKLDDELNLDTEYIGKVISISSTPGSLSVSLKRTKKDSFESISIGKVYKGIIESTDNEIIDIKLDNGVHGYSDETNLIGSTDTPIPFKVLEFNRQEKIIRLSNQRIQYDFITDELVKSFFKN